MDRSSEAEGSFAGRLRALRLAASLSQEELAERAGLTVNAIGALERGERRRPYPHTVRALADALGLSDAEREALAAAVPARAARASSPSGRTGAPMTAEPVPVGGPASFARLPVPPSPLIGREAEVRSLVDLLRARSYRLVTLTGPGGVGKTRMAWEAGARLAEDFAGAVVLVDLAPVPDAALVTHALAHALGLRELDSRGADDAGLTDAIVGFLGTRPMLVLLDNVEHVLDCAPAVTGLVARCPGLVVLATSRAPLRVRAETEMPVPPLQVPDPRQMPDAAGVGNSAAARMFLDRAAAAGAPVELTEQNAATIAAICWRLDGLPLALELAAARARLLSPTTLLARIDEAVGAGGMRDAPERQRTMRATLGWSYDLLGEPERVLFRRLSVFAGGFSLPAVEALCDPGDDALPVLGGLVEQSLVARTADPDGHPSRFRLLEPVRQYAADLLQHSDDGDRVRARHAEHFAGAARLARRGLRGGELTSCLDRLDQDAGNLRAAMRHLLESGRHGVAAGMGWDLWLYWGLRGHVPEGVGWLAAVLEGDLTGPERCRALGAAAGLRFVSGEIAEMRPLAEQALELARPDDDETGAEVAILAGSARMYDADLPGAETVLVEARERAGLARDPWAVAHALTALAQRAMLGGAPEEASALLTSAMDHARALHNPFTLATVLNVNATLAELQGNHATTAELLAEAIDVSGTARISWTRVYTLTALAGIAARAGRAETSARLFGAAASLTTSHRVDARFPASRDLADGHLSQVRALLGDREFSDAFELGRSATIPEITALAATLTMPGPG